MSTKRPRLNAESFAREEQRFHALLDRLPQNFMSTPAALHRGSDEIGFPDNDANIGELKELVSSSLRRKYGMDVASRDNTSTADGPSSLDVSPSKHKRRKEGPDADQSSNDRDDISTSTSSETSRDSSNLSFEEEESSDNSSYASSMIQIDEEMQPIRSPLFRSKQDLYRFHEDDSSEDDAVEPESIDTEKDEGLGDNMHDASVSQASIIDDASPEERSDNDWSDDMEGGGSDLDDEEEERLVRQICLPRLRAQEKNSDEEYSSDITEDKTSDENIEADEEVEIVRCNGRTYEAGKTYFRANHGATYMYAVLKLYRRPAGEKYAECAQVLRIDETFLSSVQSELYEHVRLSGVVKFWLDDRFGDEVDEIEGIPQIVYEVKRGERLHFSFYPLATIDLPRIGTSSKPTVLDMFAGAGGMHLGFHAAGFETAMAVEKNPFAVQTLSANVNRIFPGDVVAFLSDCQSEAYRAMIGPVHHLHASPPCQGFSSANRHGGQNDVTNNNLSLQFLEGVKLFQPATATYEMVTGILRRKHRIYLETIILGLVEEGYKVRCSILNASDHGDPQNRRRLFLFAARSDLELPRLPRATHGEAGHLLPRQTVCDANGDLPRPTTSNTNEMEYNGSILYNTWYPETTAKPGDADTVVLDPDKPALTVRGASSRPPLHYEPIITESGELKYRCISLREMAMIQSFPKDMKFWGNRSEQRKQVGNAVPVKLATAVAKSIRDVLTFIK